VISSVKVTGKGALMGLFCTLAKERLIGVTLYDGSDAYQRALENECGLASKGYTTTADAARIGAVCSGMGGPKADVTVQFAEPQYGCTEITISGRSGQSASHQIRWKSAGSAQAVSRLLDPIIASLRGM